MISIAIDGPAGAGKSTISRKLAEIFGFIYVDTGALYRAVGLHMFTNGITGNNKEEIIEELKNINVDIVFIDNEQRVLLNGEDVSNKIRTPRVSMMASAASAIPKVREFLFDTQQSLAEEHNVIMDGRDIGTVVLPNATVKIFLTADPEDRAQRRYKELKTSGSDTTYEEVLSDLKKRDYDDANRAIAPLKPAEDSIIVNTTGNSLEKSIEIMEKIIKDRL